MNDVRGRVEPYSNTGKSSVDELPSFASRAVMISLNDVRDRVEPSSEPGESSVDDLPSSVWSDRVVAY
jgi:hypothetical protein